MDKPTEIRPMATPNSTDDESITTSTASDTLDSWTLVTDKKNSKPANTNPIPIYETEDNIEDLPKYEDLDLETSQSNAKEEQENEPSPDHQADTTSATDEFSDEVSIISESESGDALAPHPFLREHLKTLKFTTGEGLDLASLLQQQQQEEQHRLQPKRQTTPPNTPIQFQQVSTMNSDNNDGFRQRKRRSTSVDDSQKKLKHQSEAPIPINESQVSCPLQLPRFKRRVYTFLFYLIVGLMVLGFYGKLGHWPTFIFDNSNSMYVWEKKISDLQHDNNLMRAEIDLLTKQVYYLTTLQDKMNDEKNKQKYRAKNSNRYNGGNNGKIENFDNLDESNTADPTERRNEGFQYEEYSKYPSKKYYKNDNLIMTERYSKHNGKEHQYATNNEDNSKRKDEMGENDTTYGNKKDNFNEAGDEKHKDYVNFKKDTIEKNNSNERKYKKSSEDYKDFKEQNYKNDNSKERKYKTSDDDSKEKKYKNDNSKERKYKKSNDDDDSKEYKNDNSKERKYKKQYRNDNNSKEKFNRNVNSKENSQQKQRKFNSDERFDQSGEWHDNLMKQREKARKEREEDMKRAKNWYFNRNEGREEWRNDDSHRR